VTVVRLLDVRLDSAGLSAILSGPEVRGLVLDAANRVASSARAGVGRTGRVTVETYVARGGRMLGSRVAAAVVVVGSGMEAKYGVLAQGAAAAGLQVHR